MNVPKYLDIISIELEQLDSDNCPRIMPSVKRGISFCDNLGYRSSDKHIFRYAQYSDEGSPYMKLGRNRAINDQVRVSRHANLQAVAI